MMIYTTTLTQKGQVTIPIEIRKYLGIQSREKVAFSRLNDQITISPARDFLSLKGSVKSSKKYSDKEIDKKILSYVKKQNEK